MRGAALTCQMAGVSRETFEKFHCSLFGKHWHRFPKGETTWVMLSFLLHLHLQWVIAQIALSSLSHLLWNKSKYRAQRLFSKCKPHKFLLLEPPAYMAVPSLGLTSFVTAEYSREPTLSNQINLPTLSSPSESSGPHTTIHSAGEHLVILLATSLVKYLSSQTWKRLVHLKA